MKYSTMGMVLSFAVAGLDFLLAVLFAVYGDIRFAGFMVLAGLMCVQGLHFQAKARKEDELR